MKNRSSFLSYLASNITGFSKYFSQIRISKLLILGLIFGLSNGCRKEEGFIPIQSLPVLTTTAVSSILYNSARCGGNISSNGGAAIIARGVCFGLNSEPTIADSKTINGTDTGIFTSIMGNLTAKTKYYVRAYATNNVGTAYGNIFSFTTSDLYIQGSGATDIDVNVYTTIILGSQEWFVENLKSTRYRNGDTIPNITDNTLWSNLATDACCDYENKPSNSVIYGKLYNFYAVDDFRNICPVGWHVPSNAEWTILINYLGGESEAGGKLKEVGTAHWLSPNLGATNESGFSALPGGIRGSFAGLYSYITEEGDWWTSTEDDEANAWERYVGFDNNTVTSHYYDKKLGLSVRCIKNK